MACSTEALEHAVERFQGGEDRERAFWLIFTCYFPRVRRFYSRKGVPPEDSYDLAQKTLLKVFENLDKFRRESALRTWISTIAANGFKRWLREKKRTDQEVSLEPTETSEPATRPEPEDPRPSQETEALGKERRQRLRRCLEELSSRQRLSFVLYTYHDQSYREIAATMNIEVGTVGALLNQARKKVKDCFESP